MEIPSGLDRRGSGYGVRRGERQIEELAVFSEYVFGEGDRPALALGERLPKSILRDGVAYAKL